MRGGCVFHGGEPGLWEQIMDLDEFKLENFGEQLLREWHHPVAKVQSCWYHE